VTSVRPGSVGMELHCEQIGEKGPALMFLHGLAANGAVWAPVVQSVRRCWPGMILVPDLRGHGRSPHAGHYGYGLQAADLAELLTPGGEVSIVGHSMGAVIGLTLAGGWYGLVVKKVVGFSIKVNWTEAELARVHALASSPPRWFQTRGEAAHAFLRLSGLRELVDENSEVAQAGVCRDSRGWRLAADARTFLAPGPPFSEIFRPARAQCVLACGTEDPMVKVDELRVFDPNAIELAGLGHNCHVQAPKVVAGLIERLLTDSNA